MLNPQELIDMKARMLVAGKMSQLILGEEPVQLPEQEYELVWQALSVHDQDVRTLLTELDVLRGMVTGNFNFLTGEDASHGRETDVRTVREDTVAADSGEEQPDEAAVSSTVGSGGTDGEDSSRPKPKRNTRRRSKNTKGVVRKTKKQKVDSSTDNS